MTPAAIHESERSVPPRYRWLRRIAFGTFVLLALLCVIRLAWGAYADRRFRDAVARLREAGTPVLAEDFVRPAIPDEENAAYWMKQAGMALKFEQTDGPSAEHFGWDYLLALEYPEAARALVAANAKTDELLQRMHASGKCEWRLDVGADFPIWLGGQCRSLVKYAHARALIAHAHGDLDEALHQFEIAISAADATIETRTIMGLLIGTACEALAVDTAQYIALEYGTPKVPLTLHRARVERLIARLLDDTRLHAAWTASWHADRAQNLAMTQSALDGTNKYPLTQLGAAAPTLEGPWFKLMHPAVRLRMVRVIADYERVAAVSAYRIPSALDATFAGDPAANVVFLNPNTDGALVPGWEGVGKSWRTAVAYRRLAATMLALRLYELDRGARPAALDALVPHYLTAVPIDPCDPNGGPLRYLPDGDRPVLYSLGFNGTDELESARNAIDTQTGPYEVRRYKPVRDIVFELAPENIRRTLYQPEPSKP